MMDELNDVPSWAKWTGFAGGAVAAGWLYFRQFLSSAKVDRVADDANVATILRLQDELKSERESTRSERERADALMRDRESMIAELGQLRGEVKALREQVLTLTESVRELRSNGR